MVLSLAKGAICRSEPAASGESAARERKVPHGEFQLLDISRQGSKISRLCRKVPRLWSFAWRCCCETPLRPGSLWGSPEDRLRPCVETPLFCREMAPLEAHSLCSGSRWMREAAKRREVVAMRRRIEPRFEQEEAMPLHSPRHPEILQLPGSFRLRLASVSRRYRGVGRREFAALLHYGEILLHCGEMAAWLGATLLQIERVFSGRGSLRLRLRGIVAIFRGLLCEWTGVAAICREDGAR